VDRYLPDSWLSITDGTARLSAAVVLTPRVTLDVGGEVTTLTLAGAARLPDAASIHTGGGRLVVHGVTTTSADRTSQRPMPPSPGRPFVVVASGGRLEASDATFADLGTAPADPQDRPGVQFNAGSGGSLVRTSMLRNGTGLMLGGSRDVRLEGVTISESTGDGLVLDDDRGTTMSGIRTERNGGYGVRVTGGSTDRPVTGITTAGNGKFGIIAGEATAAQIVRVASAGDVSGGLEVSRSNDVTVADFTATDEPIGVFTHLSSTNTVLDRLRTTGGPSRRGGREDHEASDGAGFDLRGPAGRGGRRRRLRGRAACGLGARLPIRRAGRARRPGGHRRRPDRFRRAGRGGRHPGGPRG